MDSKSRPQSDNTNLFKILTQPLNVKSPYFEEERKIRASHLLARQGQKSVDFYPKAKL